MAIYAMLYELDAYLNQLRQYSQNVTIHLLILFALFFKSKEPSIQKIKRFVHKSDCEQKNDKQTKNTTT